MRAAIPELDDVPLRDLCRRAGASGHAAAALAALGGALVLGSASPGVAAGCVAVAIVVGADKAYGLLARRFERGPGRSLPGALADVLAAARGDGDGRFWVVRHAEGATEAMTPSAFGRFSRVLAQGLRRIAMIDPAEGVTTNLDAPPSLSRRTRLREAALQRQVALSRLTSRPMDCVLICAFDDVDQREVPAKVDLLTGVLEPVSLPADAKGPLTQAYLAFENGGEYMLGQLPGGRFHVIDMPNFGADLEAARAPAA